MYLKRLDLQGFKSFPEKVKLEFNPGVTAVVGPNGSGKSNVSDAVRWVLGEQRARSLRGDKMEDIIFAGTENRKPLGFAEVSILIDNQDGRLPLAYSEVQVTRRVFRSGESEYRINGTACRLKDIQELFMDTGVGREGYSIIGQGQIDKILSGKPEERRELFDEAAGIVKFKRRKNTTLKKLEEEQQNLVRVTDILSELTKQLEPLERQSETAKIYLAKRENLKELDINMFLLEYEHTGNLIRELEEKTRIAENQLKEAQDAHSRTKDEYERLEKILEELNERMEALREESRDRAIRKQQLSGEINVLHEQILAGEQNDSHYRSRLLAVQEDTEKKSADQEALEEQKADLQANLREIDRKLADEQKKMDNIQSSIEECTQAVEDGKNEIIEILNSRANTKGKAQRFDAMKEQLDIRKAGISQRILSLKTQEEEQQSAIDQAQKEYDTITKAIQETREEGSRLTKEIHAIQETLKQQNTQLEKEQTSYHREASRLESLRNITERYDGYGNSIRRVMEQKNHVPGIRGVVADIIHVEKNYEIAIETALGGSIQNIVTDNEQTAKQMIEFLKKNRYGRATFLPLNSISSRGEFNQRGALNEPGAIGLASGLVTAEKEYDGLIGYLLGRVLVVDHIDHAIAIARKYRHSIRMVTLEGESLSPGGSMTGGAFKNNSNLLGRRREIEELEKKVKELAAGYHEIRQSMEDNRSRRNEMRDTVAALQQKFQEQSIQQNTARLNIEQLEKKAEEIRGGYTRIEREQEEIRLQARDMQADNIKITQELEASKRDEEELETFIETRQKELEDWKKDEAETSEKLERIRLDASASQQKESFIKENLRRLKEEIEVLSKEREEILDSLEKGSQETAEKRKTIDKVRKEIEGFAAKEEAAAKQLEKWQQEKEERTKSHKEFFEKRDELSGQISLLDKECFRLKTQAEKIEENREARISYMWEEYEITPNNALQYRKEEMNDRHVMKQQIHKLKDEIRALGSVNVNAIEDYKELLERHTFLSGQYNDLLEAEKTLEQIIQELDEGMRKQFSEKFGEIQKEFDKAFKELFGGGRGTLELAEDEDILEAGIRIISQPPGKKLQNMMQLSGGEKALTAIALLFAIQNLKPSPFCLLDEIEAALDDSNVGRFAGYLQKLTKNTQFIIITHRRGTMNAADRLYGITMQEKGVSTLVSVDLVENQLTQ